MYPSLVEPNIKGVINYHLKNCQNLKYQYKNLIYNSILLLLLVTVIGLFLYYKYKGNTRVNRIKQNIKKQEYVLSSLRKYQNIKNQPLTNLPIM